MKKLYWDLTTLIKDEKTLDKKTEKINQRLHTLNQEKNKDLNATLLLKLLEEKEQIKEESNKILIYGSLRYYKNVNDNNTLILKTKVEEFITEKAKLADGFKIYSINDPFIENFLKTDTGYAGKLKTSFVAGPKVTENDVIEIVKGKGLGTAQHDLNDVDGIGSIRIDASFPWVTSVPNNPEKITVVLDVGE